MRLFIAIKVPEYVKTCAAAVKDRLDRVNPDIKWVEYENYHLTLKFLGEVDEKDIGNIKQLLEKAAQGISHFHLAISTPGCFPGKKRPRVLFLGITGAINMALELGKVIDSNLQQMGYEPDSRRHLHLTLGRFRSERNKRELLALFEDLQPEIDPRAFKVSEFYLMESRLSKQGPEYSVVETIKLQS